MEPESTSFNPRTWVSSTPVTPPSEPAPEAPAAAPRSRRGLLIGAGVALIAGLGAVLLVWPLGSDASSAGASASGAAARPAKATLAETGSTSIFSAADMNELGGFLEGLGVPTGDAFVAARETVAALGVEGQMRVTVNLGGKEGARTIRSILAELDDGTAVELTRAGDGSFRRENVLDTSEARVRTASGTIAHSTFYASAVDAGIPNSLINEFTKAFSFDIDWAETRIGDRFSATWEERVSRSGREVAPPRLLKVEYETGGKRSVFYAFMPPEESEPRWFDETGQGNARALMRTPVEGARITSKFGTRVHPIYKTAKNHNGVDFAAPIGTPIFAAGKGTVIFEAMAGGAGNLIKIDHGDGLETRYMHLNAFAPNQGVGAEVAQGQVIGYVGTTGGSTGPHLHFEIRVAGEYVDPLSFENTVSEALGGDALRMFAAARKELAAEAARPAKPATITAR